MAVSSREIVEIFHLLFLRALFAQLDDRALVVVKGGCNVRFFFGSPRFSEDLDLDVRTIAPRTLRAKVDGILAGTSFQRVLAAKQLRIAAASAPKQTDDVQRWKIQIATGASLPESTKIEFSRRGAGEGVTEAIPSAVLERHALPPPIVATHYSKDAAVAQKVRALLGRKVPQARDVFDLQWLLGQGATVPALSAAERTAARERVLEFTEDDFRGHVLAYLEPDEQKVYASREAIDAMQLSVAEKLE